MSKTFLHLYVFLTGAAVLALELSASRLLAPSFGTSLFVWGNIFGIVLGALAFGYFYGGRLADRSPSPRTLGAVTFAAGIGVACIPLLAPMVLRNVTSALDGIPLFLIAASFLSVLALFAMPLALLGALSPLANRIGIRDVSEVGSVNGSLSASSTAGSILGAFLPAFVTIPLWGTRATILASAAILLALGAAASGKKRLFLALLLPAFLAFSGGARAADPSVVFEKESPYQHIRVIAKDGRHFLIANEGGGVQTIEPDERGLTGAYTDSFVAAAHLVRRDGPLDVLHIGVAGGSAILQMERFFGKERLGAVDAVEIDPAMFEAAERFFGLGPEQARRVVADGRSFLRTAAAPYDLIIIDAYQDELYIPFHLATVEFFALARERMREDGVLLLNVLGESPEDPLLLHLAGTVREAFPYAATARTGGLNHLVAASRKPLPWERLSEIPGPLRPSAEELLSSRRAVEPNGLILTDDRAPLEYLTDRFLWRVVSRAVGR